MCYVYLTVPDVVTDATVQETTVLLLFSKGLQAQPLCRGTKKKIYKLDCESN